MSRSVFGRFISLILLALGAGLLVVGGVEMAAREPWWDWGFNTVAAAVCILLGVRGWPGDQGGGAPRA